MEMEMEMDMFTARAGAAQEIEDYNTFVVVLAESKDGSGARLEFQRSIEPDEEDESLGAEAYCLCTQTQATCYGGVQSWSIRDRVLKLELSQVAADKLGTTLQIEIGLSFSDTEIQAVIAGLERVFMFPASSGGSDFATCSDSF